MGNRRPFKLGAAAVALGVVKVVVQIISGVKNSGETDRMKPDKSGSEEKK